MPERRSRIGRALARAAVAVVTGGVAVASGATAAAEPGGYHRYVALGDSYAAVGAWTSMNGNPVGCLRASDSYPADVARAVGAGVFLDVSCSAAITADMARPQVPNLYGVPVGGLNPPQFDALTPDTDLATISIGGNDIGLSDILQACMARALGDPGGQPCRNFYTAGGFDRLTESIDAVAPRIALTLDGIRQRAPQADIVVVGYLPILPADGRGCFPSVPIAAGDAPYLAEVQRRLNGMLADQAARHGAVFADTAALGHDAYQPAGFNWSNPLFFPNPLNTWPFHPNIAGQAFIADRITAALRR
ncbi:SGNH/GDSL hydrolase family protein [Nocardia crassostreae]|uniref:SGNH/GDSL hydrolase family protein n=1 Tax=Nocardia crassostreae TaxID=53428 RepID=UPI00082BF2E6|nr:SGNH/GDSL hydrolase family protein [Nocardia crassostreae]